jgi:hypothetical protein
MQHKKRRRLLTGILLLTVVLFAIKQAGSRLNMYEEFGASRYLSAVKAYQPEHYRYGVDSLKTLYGTHKQLIKEYELQILLALSHYPELKNTPICFYEESAFIPLASRPEPISMFGSKNKWRYNIIISTESTDELKPVLLQYLPFNAQVGIIGHELAHTVFYLDKSIWQMMLIGLNYPLPSFRARFEKNTDRRAVAHGLGWQLLEYARYARKVMPYDDTYLGSEYYLSPQEIIQQMEKYTE